MEEYTKWVVAAVVLLFILWLVFANKPKHPIAHSLAKDIRFMRRCDSKPPYGFRGASCQDGSWVYTCPDAEHAPSSRCDPSTGKWVTSSGCPDNNGEDDTTCIETDKGSKWLSMLTIPNDTTTDGVLTPQFNTPLVLNP